MGKSEQPLIQSKSSENQMHPIDRDYCERRIKETEKVIKSHWKNIEKLEKQLERIDAGEVLKRNDGTIITSEHIKDQIKCGETILEEALSKVIYYRELLGTFV